MKKTNLHLIATAALLGASSASVSAGAVPAPLADWPKIESAVRRDAKLEAQLRNIVAGMTLAQTAAIANIRVAGGVARRQDALACEVN
jgi:beta-glucosidase